MRSRKNKKQCMYIKLSYELTTDTPLPMKDITPFTAKEINSIEKGDISNIFYFKVNTHAGSHIDAPNHFYQNGKRIAEFDITSFIFQKPFVVKIPKQDSESITSTDLEPFSASISYCDLLLLRTEFSRYRRSESLRYISKNPSLSIDAAAFIRKTCKKIRALGIDCPSIATPEHPEEGIKAHKILLSNKKHPVLLIEDINLEHNLMGLKKVFAFPLFAKGVDSSPCTVVAEIER